MDYKSTIAVQQASQVIKGAADVYIRYVHMPMLMRPLRTMKPSSLQRWLCRPPGQQTRALENPIHAAETNSHNILVQHHECQPPIPLIKMFQVIGDNGLFLPILQLKIPRNPVVMLIDFAVPTPPVVVCAALYPQPGNKQT
jgi:hypothetical protein